MAKKEKSRQELRAKLPDRIREAIMAAVKAQGLSPYKLAKMVEQYVAPTTVYQFMAEETGLRTDVASVLLDALGLEITDKK